jgi:Protein of unknown function (DUF3108)
MERRAVTATMLIYLAGAASLAAAPTTRGKSGDAAGADTPATADAGLAPFAAHYQADWKSISVGTSDLVLKRDAIPGHYVYTWTITARGIFRMVYRDDLIQKSWFSIEGDHIRPGQYRAVDGSSSVELNFDWAGGHVRGTSENKPVDLALKEGTQDLMSIQVEVMLDLQKGDLPKSFQIIDKDELKEFNYTQVGTASIRTDIGQLDTIIVESSRPGNDRILRMWFAPSLGFVPVQAERTRGGKLEFAMRIKSLNRSP